MTTNPDWLDDPTDDAARVCGAISDITPLPFRDRIDRLLRESIMMPGQLTRVAARVTDRDADPEEIDRRVVGVQLIYEGLRLTRTLARSPPWEEKPESDADLEILIAEVLVARGFSLLARTEAVAKAVEVVRTFGRNEMDRHVGRPDYGLPNRTLETNVFELSIVAGVTAGSGDRPTGIRGFATMLSESMDGKHNDGDTRFSESVVEELTELVSETVDIA